jgi:RNA polymerase sigma factor (sigma-70 family)
VTELRDPAFDDALCSARAGEEWAWARIYERLAPRIVGYLRAHGATDPEDLAGEVFLHVVRGLPEFTGGERDFNAWTFTIAHRRLVDDLRRRGRRPLELLDGDAVAEVAGAGGDVFDDAEARLSEAAARAAIDELPTDQRTVVLLRIIGDLTIDDIARTLGKRPGAVKALQRRGLRRLKRAYPFARPER